MIIEVATERPWSSLTFAGTRHHFTLRLPAGLVRRDLDAAVDIPRMIIAVERIGWDLTEPSPQLTIDLLAIDAAM